MIPRSARLVALLIAALLLVRAAASGLDRLHAARRAAADAARAPAPVVTLPAGTLIVAATRDAALRRLAADLRREAARGGVLVEQLVAPPPAPAPAPALAVVQLAASGRERDMLRFVNWIEQARPAIRFLDWRLVRQAEGGAGLLRLEARAAAGWRTP